MTTVRPIDCCDVPLLPAPALPCGDVQELVGLFRALGDVTRLEVFRLIAAQEGPICVCDITDRFEVSQPTISHHLKVLREAGLITVSRRGNWAFYGLNRPGLAKVNEAIAIFGADRIVVAA